MSVKATKDTFRSEISTGLVMADFYSDSCVPCKRMSPVLAELEEQTGVKLVKLNVNFDGQTAAEYGVTAVPTVIFFRNSEEQQRVTGAVKKAQLEEIINTLK